MDFDKPAKVTEKEKSAISDLITSLKALPASISIVSERDEGVTVMKKTGAGVWREVGRIHRKTLSAAAH